MNILVIGIYFFIYFGYIFKGNFVCKEIKLIVEIVLKDVLSFKIIVIVKL